MPGPLGHVPGRTPPAPSPRAFLTRAMSGIGPDGGTAWARHNKLTAPLEFMHNLSRVFPLELYASHPDYFPLVGGARMLPAPPPRPTNWNPDLGNPEVAAHAAAVAREAFKQHPGAVSFSLGVNDALIFGESPETLALVTPLRWFRGRPDYSNLVFTFMNRAAADVARTHPDKYLGCLAYYWCENIPSFPVAPNVAPFLTADRSQGYDPAFKQEELTQQDRWARSGARRLGMYDYLDGFGFLVPRVHTRLIAENIRHARRAGFTDYYGEASPNWGLEGPMSWLVAQLLQDPEQSETALLDEYYRRYFRSAAVPMRRFFERCEEQWMRQPGPQYWLKYYRDQSQADLFPSAVCRELRGLLEEAARAGGTPEVKARIALVADAFALTERFVDFCEARTNLVRHQLEGTLAGDAGAQEIQEYVRKRVRLTVYAAWLGRTRPLAIYSTKLDDFLRDDPLYGAAAEELRTEGLKAEGLKAEGLKAEGLKAEGLKAEGLKAERLKAEGLKAEGLKAEGLKAEGLKAEGLKAEGLKAERLKAEGLKAERLKAEGLKAERLKAERLKAEGLKAEGLKAEGLKAEGLKAETGNLEMAVNGSLEDPVVPGRRIGGLAYSLDLPASWASTCEPAQAQSVATTRAAARSGIAGLHFEGTLDAALFQWVQAVPGRVYDASVFVRGRVSPGDSVALTVGWLDAGQQHLGDCTVERLPEGEWAGWVRLRQGGVAPPGAHWVGIGVRVQHQVPGDWVDVDDFSLVQFPASPDTRHE